MRPKNLVEYIAGGNLPVKKGHRKDGDGQNVLVPQKSEPDPAGTAESSTAPADTKASVQDPASISSPLSLSRGRDSRNTKIKKRYGTCQCKGVHFEETLKSAMKKDSDNIYACTCIVCRARKSKSDKRTDDETTEQSHGRTKRECLERSISKQNKNKGRNASTHQRQESDNTLSSEFQKLSEATSSEYRTHSSNFLAQISNSKEPTKQYLSQRSPKFVVVIMSRLLMPSRSEVVIREDVIECQSDPRPNAFFDSRIGVMRVYHGPNFGNPSATLAPLGNQGASPGPEIGDSSGGWADRMGNREPDLRWIAISGPQPGGRQGSAQFGPSGWSGGPWASGGRNDNPSNSQQGSGRNDVRIHSHNRTSSNKNQRRPGNDNHGWNKSEFNSSESHNNAGNSIWNRNNSTTWDDNNDRSNDQANDDSGNNGGNWKNAHTSDNYNNKFNNDDNAKNDSTSDHNYKEDYAGDSNNLPGAWPSDKNESNDYYDNNGGNGGDFNDDSNQKSGWNTPTEPAGWSRNFCDTSNDHNWGGDNSKFNNDNTDNFGDWKNSNDNNQNNNDNYRSSSKNQSSWNRNNQNDQSRSHRKQNNNNSGKNSFGNKAFDNNQSGSPTNRGKRMNQDQSRHWNPDNNLADSSWYANPAQTVLSNNSWDDSNAVGPTATNGGGRGRASSHNDTRNRRGNTVTSASRAPQGSNRNSNFGGNKNASNRGSNKGSGNFNGNDTSRDDANNEWGPPAVQASWADPTVAADTSGWGASSWK